MKVYILGRNRVEMGNVKTKDLDKHFYVTRGQLYKMYPDNLTRMIRYEYGVRRKDEEAIIYPENGTVPLQPRNGDYDQRLTMALIDAHRMPNGAHKSKSILTQYKEARGEIKAAVPFLIVAVAFLWSFLS